METLLQDISCALHIPVKPSLFTVFVTVTPTPALAARPGRYSAA